MNMRKKILALVVVLLAGIMLYFMEPERRVKRFVTAHREELEEAYQTGIVPAGIGYKMYNLWDDGEHPMLEFILLTTGNAYYGCYYSPDGVPLPFQNVDVELTQNDQMDWVWYGGGDNHGTTSQIADRWYYFEASF